MSGRGPDSAARWSAAQGAAPLTPLQVKALAQEARKAWEAQRALGLADEGFDTWRHGAVQDAVPGRRGLRDLAQRDYAPALAYFRFLSGGDRPDPAAAAADERRRAAWRLRREMRDAADALGGDDGARRYAESLFHRIHGTSPERATPAQVLDVAMTIRLRAAAKRKAARPAESRRSAPAAPDGERPPEAARRVFPRLSRAAIGIGGGR